MDLQRSLVGYLVAAVLALAPVLYSVAGLAKAVHPAGHVQSAMDDCPGMPEPCDPVKSMDDCAAMKCCAGHQISVIGVISPVLPIPHEFSRQPKQFPPGPLRALVLAPPFRPPVV